MKKKLICVDNRIIQEVRKLDWYKIWEDPSTRLMVFVYHLSYSYSFSLIHLFPPLLSFPSSPFLPPCPLSIWDFSLIKSIQNHMYIWIQAEEWMVKKMSFSLRSSRSWLKGNALLLSGDRALELRREREALITLYWERTADTLASRTAKDQPCVSVGWQSGWVSTENRAERSEPVG